MCEDVKAPDGSKFTVSFKKGVPPAGSGPWIYLLDDGSIYSGAIVESTTFPAGALSTTNPVGGFHEIFEIPLRRIIGYAFAGNQYPFD
jgi:hypothetical protein